MVKVSKNRVVPSSQPTQTTSNINNDPFFTSSSSKTQKTNKKIDDPNKFFGKPKRFNTKNTQLEKTRLKFIKGVDQSSKNIRKVKAGNPLKKTFQQKPNKFESHISNDKFKKIDEDSELKNHNSCKALVKFEGIPHEKKPFDKKKWRLQKYSKKYKLEQFEEKRKKSVLNQYYNQIKDDNSKTDVQKIYEQYDSDQEDQPIKKNYVQNPNYKPELSRKKNTKLKVRLELERLKQEKQMKKEEILKKKQEKEEALKEYKQKKIQKQKLLNKKTKRGQPVMKGRLEMLLEKIQNG